MPHVTTHYRVITTAAHHRQPRSSAAWIEPNPQSDAEVVAGTMITPYAPPQLAYTAAGQAQVATFLFWNATDGASGQTSTSQTLTQTVGSAPMTLTAWYLPPQGNGNGTHTGYTIDAFSDALDGFIDDTFVEVTTDPSLTSDANVVGWVPTAAAETLRATGAVHTGETFEHWIGGQPASGDDDNLPAGENGVAIATYQGSAIPLPGKAVKTGELAAWLILFGIINDAPGLQFPLGGGGPVPVGPWGPFLERVTRAALVGSMAHQMHASAEIGRIAATEVLQAAQQLHEQIVER
jgi:hypothetical protein